jgi:hypothetical protein
VLVASRNCPLAATNLHATSTTVSVQGRSCGRRSCALDLGRYWAARPERQAAWSQTKCSLRLGEGVRGHATFSATDGTAVGLRFAGRHRLQELKLRPAMPPP